jgi:hypothetical protein
LVTQLHLLAARRTRVLHNHRPSENRGRRECRASNAPAALCAKSESTQVKVTTGSPNKSGTPCANGFNGFLRSLPGDRLCCLRRRRDATHLDRLDTSVGVSGRYDFAVRASCVRLAHDTRPPHPAPNVRDDREAPLFVRRGMARIMPVIWDRDQHSRAATFQHDGQITSRGRNAVKPFSRVPEAAA